MNCCYFVSVVVYVLSDSHVKTFMSLLSACPLLRKWEERMGWGFEISES